MKTGLTFKNQNTDHYANTIALFFIIAYILIDFLPSFNALDIVSPQYVYLAVLNIVVGIYCYCNPSKLSGCLIPYLKGTILKIYTIFLIICGLSIFAASTVSLALISFSQLIIVFVMCINITILLHNRLNLLSNIIFIVGLSVFVQSFILLVDFSKTMDLGAIKGNNINVNIMASSLNIKVPFLILGFIYFSNWKKILLGTALMLSVLIIFLTSSRATILALFFEIIVFIVFYIKIEGGAKKSNFIKITPIIVLVFLSFITANQIFKKIGDSERYKSVEDRISQIQLKTADASIDIRLKLWRNALDMCSKKPLLGIGIGNWKIESLPYERTIFNDNDTSANTHNDFFQIFAETGLLNGVMYLSLFVFVFFVNLKRVLKPNEGEIKIIALLCLMLFLSYGIDAFFNFPLFQAKMQLGFCLLLVLTLVNSPINMETKSFFSRLITLFLLALTSVCLYFAFSQFKASQLEYKYKAYVRQSASGGKYVLRADDIIANLPEFPTVGIFGGPFVQFTGVCLLNQNRDDEALKYFREAIKINPYLGHPEWYMHLIETRNGNLESAYKHAKMAFYKRPRNSTFYLSVLSMANKKKDTLEILKIHNLYTKYRKTASNWINTANALQISGYSSKNLSFFINDGLKQFPGDSLLLKRKSTYEFSSINNYLIVADRYLIEQDFDKAILYYKKALKGGYDNVLVKQNLGSCYLRLNQYRTAISYLLPLINNPQINNGKTEFMLGISYYNIKDKNKACAYWNLAKKKNFIKAEQLIQQYCK